MPSKRKMEKRNVIISIRSFKHLLYYPKLGLLRGLLRSHIELEELAAALNQYIEILIDGDTGIEETIAAISGHYFRTFFLTLHSLEMEEHISIAKLNHVLYDY